MRKPHLLFLMFSVLLTSCNSFTKDDSQKDSFFLRKKYHITRIYDINEDGSLSNSYLTPASLNFDIENTYMDFYYGGLDYFKENGSKFIMSVSFNGSSTTYDTDYLNKMNGIIPIIGEYKLDRKRDYAVPFYLNFENANKHLLLDDYNSKRQMYEAIAFPEYFIRLNFLLYLKSSENAKKVCLEFGKISKINELEDIPHI